MGTIKSIVGVVLLFLLLAVLSAAFPSWTPLLLVGAVIFIAMAVFIGILVIARIIRNRRIKKQALNAKVEKVTVPKVKHK